MFGGPKTEEEKRRQSNLIQYVHASFGGRDDALTPKRIEKIQGVLESPWWDKRQRELGTVEGILANCNSADVVQRVDPYMRRLNVLDAIIRGTLRVSTEDLYLTSTVSSFVDRLESKK